MLPYSEQGFERQNSTEIELPNWNSAQPQEESFARSASSLRRSRGISEFRSWSTENPAERARRYCVPHLSDALHIISFGVAFWMSFLLIYSADLFFKDIAAGRTVSWTPADLGAADVLHRSWCWMSGPSFMMKCAAMGWHIGEASCENGTVPAIAFGTLSLFFWTAGDVLIGLGGGSLGFCISMISFLLIFTCGPRSWRAKRKLLFISLVTWYGVIELAMWAFFMYGFVKEHPLPRSFLPLGTLVYEFLAIRAGRYIFGCFRGSAPVETHVLLICVVALTGEASRMAIFLSHSLKFERNWYAAGKLCIIDLVLDIPTRLSVYRVLFAHCRGYQYHAKYDAELFLCARFKLKLIPVGLVLGCVYVLIHEQAVLNSWFWIYLALYFVTEAVSDAGFLWSQRWLWVRRGESSETLIETIRRVQSPFGLRFPRLLERFEEYDADFAIPDAGDPLKGLYELSPSTTSAVFLVIIAISSSETFMLGNVIQPSHLHWQ